MTADGSDSLAKESTPAEALLHPVTYRYPKMPISIDEFESASEEGLGIADGTNADHVLEFLAGRPESAFTRKEVQRATEISPGSIGVVLARLEAKGLVRHKGKYWAIAEDDRLATYRSMVLGTRAANDRFGPEDMDEWTETAVDPREHR